MLICLKIGLVPKQNTFTRSSILKQFSMSSLESYILIGFWAILGFFDLLEPNFSQTEKGDNFQF